MRTVLVHGASIGELLAAEPVVTRLRAMHSDLSFVFSHTSSSVSGWPSWSTSEVRRLPVPWPGATGRWLDRIAPALIALSRGDLWPLMLRAARRRNVPVVVIGGRIRPASWRLRWPLRTVLARGARDLQWVGAVTDADARRWRQLGTPRDRITVTGDPAVDRVLERVPDPLVTDGLRDWAGDDPVLVFGSVEREDIAAVVALLAEAPRAIVVPHDPGGIPTPGEWATWSPGTPIPSARVLCIQRRGVLADCYHVARAAFVGGGYARRAHDETEPAAAAVPVLRGPDDLDVLVARWRRWRDDSAAARTDGAAARGALEAARGAAARTAEFLAPYVT